MLEDKMPQYLDMCRDNIIVADAFTKANQVINHGKHKSMMCSISGGADSDIMLDIVRKVDTAIYHPRMRYFWFNTGLEYNATKEHIDYLEKRYDIHIHRINAQYPIPWAVKRYGQPFISKYVSENIDRLQRNNFKFEYKPLDELLQLYPKAKSSVLWWCNANKSERYNIDYKRYLKQFLIENPPKFKISSMCCDYAKKYVAKDVEKRFEVDLSITGVRKSEGGIRSIRYSSCFDTDKLGIHRYRPLFWFTADDKLYYEERFGIEHSRCYTEYGFNRTGCVCCPYSNQDLQVELDTVKKFEPQLYLAATTVFKDSIAYTNEWLKFQRSCKDAYLQSKKCVI